MHEHLGHAHGVGARGAPNLTIDQDARRPDLERGVVGRDGHDAEIAQVDNAIRRTTIEKFGPVRSVKPTMVFEIGFEGIALSPRHKAGIAVRFPRILRRRDDKPIEEADTLDTLKGLLAAAGA